MSQRARKILVATGMAMALVLAAPAAQADDYEADRAGHPLRLIAYVLHPVGVVLDYLLIRPTHWLGHQQPFKTLFGHQDD